MSEPTFALDVSINRLEGIIEQYDDCEFMQLRTPLTGYRSDDLKGIPYLLDNGAFTIFHESKWLRMSAEGINDEHCIGIVVPDVVADWTRTLFDFERYKRWVPIDKRFIVLQDGCTRESIPWGEIVGVFVGGTTSFKYSEAVFECIKEAKRRNKWVHVGRVNTPLRLLYFDGWIDSFDGSGLSRFDEMLDNAVETIRMLRKTHQMRLDDFGGVHE